MILLCSGVWIKVKHKRLWLICMKVPLALILVGTRWLKRSYGQGTAGPLWKQTVISIHRFVISARFMLIRCMYLRFLWMSWLLLGHLQCGVSTWLERSDLQLPMGTTSSWLPLITSRSGLRQLCLPLLPRTLWLNLSDITLSVGKVSQKESLQIMVPISTT